MWNGGRFEMVMNNDVVLPCQVGSVIAAERSDLPQGLLWRSPEAQARDLRSKLGLESVCAPLCGS